MLAYLKSGYRPVVFIDNMSDQVVTSLVDTLEGYTFHLFVLVARDEVLRKRIELRERGFRDVASSLAMSRAIMSAYVPGESIIDTSDLGGEEVGRVLLATLNALRPRSSMNGWESNNSPHR